MAARLPDRPLRGDEAELYREHHAELVRIVSQQVRAPRALIEDACQNAWVRLLRRQPRRESWRPWLITVAIHQAYELIGRERRAEPLDDAVYDVAGPDDVSERAAELGLVQRRAALVDALRPRQRAYLTLHAAGYRYHEIAELAGVTYTNVNRHIAEGRARLRELEHSAA